MCQVLSLEAICHQQYHRGPLGADGRQDEIGGATLSNGCITREWQEVETPSCCDAG